MGGPKSRAEQRVLARQKRLIHQYHTHHTTPRAPAIFWSSPNSQAPGGRAHARLGSVLSSSASVQDKIELPGPGRGVRSGREREGVARASSMAPAAVAAPVASVSPGGGAVRSARRIASLHPCHSSSKCHCYSLAFSSSPSCYADLIGNPILLFLCFLLGPLSQNRAAATPERPAQIGQAEEALRGTEQHLGKQHR